MPKAHLRRPENPYQTWCGLALLPWRTFAAGEVNELIAAGQIGLTDTHICRKCRQQGELPYSSAAAAELAARQAANEAAARRQPAHPPPCRA